MLASRPGRQCIAFDSCMLAARSERRPPGAFARNQLLLLLLLLGLVPGESLVAWSIVDSNSAALFNRPPTTRITRNRQRRMEVHDTGSTGVSTMAVSSRATMEILRC